jgi:hypothetical protein
MLRVKSMASDVTAAKPLISRSAEVSDGYVPPITLRLSVILWPPSVVVPSVAGGELVRLPFTGG